MCFLVGPSGTSITEEQLLLESPPASPGSPGWCGRLGRLPDLVTSCDLRSPGPTGTVFVFPDTAAQAPAPAPTPAPVPSPELLERLCWPVPGSPRLPASPRVPGGAEMPAAAAAAAAAAAPPVAADTAAADVGRSLRQCADSLSLASQDRGPTSPRLLPCSVEMAAVCGIACVAASCVCYKLCK